MEEVSDWSRGDHFYTCTTHSGVKTTHDWTVDQIDDLFRTTLKVKTEQVVHKSLDRFDSRSDPSINGHLHHPNEVDRSLNEDTTDKIRQ